MPRIGTVGLVGMIAVCLSQGQAILAAGPNEWAKLGDGQEQRQGSTLVWAADLGKPLLVAESVQAFDQGQPGQAKPGWARIPTSKPDAKFHIDPYYQTAYDAKTHTVYCLSNSNVLYACDVSAKAWRANPPAEELDGLSWLTAAADDAGHLVVVGSDKRMDNVGWTRTVVYDIASGKWATLPLPPADVVKKHHDLVEATERTIDLVGRIRLAWYRDPKGVGTEDELKALSARCAELGKLAGMAAFKDDLASVATLIDGKTTLDALKIARALQRRIEDAAFEQYPAPCSRRNAPLVYDATNKLFVLFGGDHEDYQLNDTWTLDLATKAWKRMKPDVAPSPRAGHAACFLPKSFRVAVYEGYVASSSMDYGAGASYPINPRQLWLYDARADRWDLAGSWSNAKAKDAPPVAQPPSAVNVAQPPSAVNPPAVGKFYGYSASYFEVAPLAADGNDTIYLATPGGKDQPGSMWALQADAGKLDAAGRDKLGAVPNSRRYRDTYFRADYCEVPDDPKSKDLAALPANQWVEMSPVRSPAHGCRQRDWSTATWDSDNEQVLMWGGGHCVRSGGAVLHYSPQSNRIVEGYDSDEPYQFNGFCGPGSSLLGRQWIDTHAYHLYAYDPNCKLLVTARGFLYDPQRMDWVRPHEPVKPPFRYGWGSVVIATSPHGAVAWANAAGSDKPNLWLFDRQAGWQDLKPAAQGDAKLFTPYCDSHGMVYDSKRDRMLISGVGGGYSKLSNGTFLAFDFKTKALEVVAPENGELAKTNIARELAYIEHTDMVLIGDLLRVGDPKTGKLYTRVFDCGRNRMALLDAGPVAAGFSAGWMYSTRTHLAYSFNFRGEAWALRIDPKTIQLLDKAGQ